METTIFRTGESSQAHLYCRATAVSQLTLVNVGVGADPANDAAIS